MVKWAHALKSAEQLPNRTYELTFANGVTVTADVVIGADGTHSRIRPLVSSAEPAYTGYEGAEISLTPQVAAAPEHTDLAEAVGQGHSFILGGCKALIPQRNGDGRVRTYAFFHSFHAGSSLILWINSRCRSLAVAIITPIATRSDLFQVKSSSGSVGGVGSLNLPSDPLGRRITRTWSAAPVRYARTWISHFMKFSVVRIGTRA
jgi:hypothetical protein